MAEIGLIASVIQVAGAGLKLSQTLYQYAESVSTADRRVKDIAKEVELTAFVIDELGHIFKEDTTAALLSKNAVRTADETVRECSNVFTEMDTAIKKTRKNTLGKLMMPFREPKLDLLRSNIDRLKSTLQLLMLVLNHAHQIASQKFDKEAAATHREQIKALIRNKKDSTKRYEESLKNYSTSEGGTLMNDDEDKASNGNVDVSQPDMGIFSAASSIGSTITTKSLMTCVQHIRSLLDDIEVLQKTLGTETDGTKAADHEQNLIGSYFRARGHLDTVILGSSRSIRADSRDFSHEALRTSTTNKIEEEHIVRPSRYNSPSGTNPNEVKLLIKQHRPEGESPELSNDTMSSDPNTYSTVHVDLRNIMADYKLAAKKGSISFTDAIGRLFSFSYESCRTWKGMEECIIQAFDGVRDFEELVKRRCYELVDSKGLVMIPRLWNSLIEPGSSITMKLLTLPMVNSTNANPVKWITFQYLEDRIAIDYEIRSDVESINTEDLTSDFKLDNCIYLDAYQNQYSYQSTRLQFETECNKFGWALAQLNPSIRSDRRLLQRAVDACKNASQDPRLRSRRVRRMAKTARSGADPIEPPATSTPTMFPRSSTSDHRESKQGNRQYTRQIRTETGRSEERVDIRAEAGRYSTGLHDPRRQGYTPQPNITIYNTAQLDNESNSHLQADQHGPPQASARFRPQGRPQHIANEWAGGESSRFEEPSNRDKLWDETGEQRLWDKIQERKTDTERENDPMKSRDRLANDVSSAEARLSETERFDVDDGPPPAKVSLIRTVPAANSATRDASPSPTLADMDQIRQRMSALRVESADTESSISRASDPKTLQQELEPTLQQEGAEDTRTELFLLESVDSDTEVCQLAEVVRPDDPEETSSDEDAQSGKNSDISRIAKLQLAVSDSSDGHGQKSMYRKKKRWSAGVCKRSYSDSSEYSETPEELDAHAPSSSTRRVRRRMRDPAAKAFLILDDDEITNDTAIADSDKDIGVKDAVVHEQGREFDIIGDWPSTHEGLVKADRDSINRPEGDDWSSGNEPTDLGKTFDENAEGIGNMSIPAKELLILSTSDPEALELKGKKSCSETRFPDCGAATFGPLIVNDVVGEMKIPAPEAEQRGQMDNASFSQGEGEEKQLRERKLGPKQEEEEIYEVDEVHRLLVEWTTVFGKSD